MGERAREIVHATITFSLCDDADDFLRLEGAACEETLEPGDIIWPGHCKLVNRAIPRHDVRGPQRSSTTSSDTCAATMRQPSGVRIQVWLWRPAFPLPVRTYSM